MTDKPELRQQIRERLSRLSEGNARDFSARITQQFIASQSLIPQSHIALYIPLKGEVDCRNLIDMLLRAGHTTCLPVVQERGLPLLFRQYRTGDFLQRGMLGPMEPDPATREVIPDILVLPMLGYNRQGYRLGYGTGFYDRTLAQLRAMKPLRVIGLAYSLQETDDLPIEPHDARLDVIITENEILDFP